jgi:electron transfer flavoprotein beta subunit
VKIAVCIKRVPDSEARIRIAPDGRSIDPASVNYDISPYDEYALEEALKIKDAQGAAVEVCVFCAGPAEAAAQIRRALAMGADRGVLLKGDFPFGDAAVATPLAGALKAFGPDLVLFGKQAIDDDALQVPAFVAQALDIPLVSVVTKLEVKDGKALAHRQIEGGHEVVEAALPAAISCQKGLNVPRFASLPNIMKAKKKPLEEVAATPVAARAELVSLVPPPVRKAGRIVGLGPDAVTALLHALHTEAKVI